MAKDLFSTLSDKCPIKNCILTDCSSTTAAYTKGDVEINDDGLITLTKMSTSGVTGIKLCVACSNDLVTESAKIKITQMNPKTT